MNMQSDINLWQEILEKFHASGSAPKDWPEDWQLASPVIRRKEARVFHLRSASAAREIGIKIYDGANATRGHHYMYKALVTYHACSRDGLTVPDAYGVVPEYKAVIMEWVNAPKASHVIFRDVGFREKRARNIALTARWLRWFHEQSGISYGAYDPGQALRKIRRIIERINAVDATVLGNNRLFAECIDFMETHSVKYAGVQLPHTILHGDFTLSNIFVDGNRAIGIDFMGRGKSHIFDDICRFLIYLDVYRYKFTGVGELQKFGCNKTDLESFMQGYGEDLTKLPGDMLLFLQFCEVVRRWCAIMELKTRKKRNLLRRLELFRVRRMARHILRGLQKKMRQA